MPQPFLASINLRLRLLNRYSDDVFLIYCLSPLFEGFYGSLKPLAPFKFKTNGLRISYFAVVIAPRSQDDPTFSDVGPYSVCKRLAEEAIETSNRLWWISAVDFRFDQPIGEQSSCNIRYYEAILSGYLTCLNRLIGRRLLHVSGNLTVGPDRHLNFCQGRPS